MKFCGAIGFWTDEEFEDSPGIWRSKIIERDGYVGDIIRNSRSFRESNHQNDDFTITNQISIISDLYAQQNYSSIRYVLWNGVKWKASNVTIGYPRIIIELGGVYKDDCEESET